MSRCQADGCGCQDIQIKSLPASITEKIEFVNTKTGETTPCVFDDVTTDFDPDRGLIVNEGFHVWAADRCLFPSPCSCCGTEDDSYLLAYSKQARKEAPLARGLLDYFPAACEAVANLSWVGNEQHNPGKEMHHARGKSTDQADCILRHLADRGLIDDDGVRHSTKVAWRALALLQEELEQEEGARLARGAREA